MKDKIVLTLNDAYMFLVSAVRYAVGRKTYIVGWTCRQVRAIAPQLTTDQRKVIVESIHRCEDYGSEYDKKGWLELAKWLESYHTNHKMKAKR